jgi:hypothetical protein
MAAIERPMGGHGSPAVGSLMKIVCSSSAARAFVMAVVLSSLGLTGAGCTRYARTTERTVVVVQQPASPPDARVVTRPAVAASPTVSVVQIGGAHVTHGAPFHFSCGDASVVLAADARADADFHRRVLVNATPWLTVRSDAQAMGSTPAWLSLAPGSHDLEIENPRDHALCRAQISL